MAGFLMLDLSLFETHPQLSNDAKILYSFIKFKMQLSKTDDAGNSYINFLGDNDPRPVLNFSKKMLMKRTAELVEAGLITTEGQRWNYKVYLGAQIGTKDPDLGDKNGTKDDDLGTQTVTKIENPEKSWCPNGDQLGAQMVTNLVPDREPSPFNINIEEKIEYRNNTQCVYIYKPTLEEVREEIAAKGYKIADPQKFIDFNEAKGWTIKDWKKALEMWSKQEYRKKYKTRIPSISGAESGLFECDLTVPDKNAAQVRAEDINPDYYYEDSTGFSSEFYQTEEKEIQLDIDHLIDIW